MKLLRFQKELLYKRLNDRHVMTPDPNYSDLVIAVEEWLDDMGLVAPSLSKQLANNSMADFTDEEIADDAVMSAYLNAKSIWRATALEIVHRTATECFSFTVDEFRDNLEKAGVETHDNRAMGGIMRSASSKGWIKASGHTVRSRVGHGSPLQVWESQICQHKGRVAIQAADDIDF